MLADDVKDDDQIIDVDSNLHDTGFKSAYSEQAFNPQDKEVIVDVDKVEEEPEQPNPFRDEIENTPAYLRKFIVNTKKVNDNEELWTTK